MAIGVLGGTFNPIHVGHLILAQEIRIKMNLSKIIFIPSKIPPLKNISISPQHRYNMVQIAIANNPFFEISDIELKSDHISHTYKTMQKLKMQTNEAITFIIGADNILSLPEWYRWQDLLTECEIVVASRPDYPFSNLQKLKTKIPQETYQKLYRNLIEIPLVFISSTTIRQKCHQKNPIRYFVPESVREYITKYKLYQDA
ncbi:nicotinate-nucleotide adenylyltransferase [Candidatus Uabimicrobium sp. HlEnr_7]|uniref:nicotinate-nucleotide adenylyltransferase n=1 Tax=Candidatus Uabimicrobium helgolandensis TaxID=3095367 RepID=UPI003556A5F7